MTKDELKKKLKSAAALQRQLESNCSQLQNLRNIANNVTPMYGPRAGGGGTGQKIENAVVNIVDLEASIQQEMNKLVATMSEVRQLIALVGDKNLEVVLYKRYLNYQNWEQIAADMSYSLRRILQLHDQALNAILKKTDGSKTKLAKPRKAKGDMSRKRVKHINFEEQKLF